MAGVEGRKIVSVRSMTKEELDREYWDENRVGTIAIELDNGVVLFPSRDPEGNGPGALFGYDPESESGFLMRAETKRGSHA